MFNSYSQNPYNTTGISPYYPQPFMQTTPQNNMVNTNTNTNKIFVSGIDDVKTRILPQGSDFIFVDNEKDVLYEKIVDNTGKFEVKAFKITPYDEVSNSSIDLSEYTKKTDLEPLYDEIKGIKKKIDEIKEKQ